jgi:putative transposase
MQAPRFACSVTKRGPVLDVSRSGDDAWARRVPSPCATWQRQRGARIRAVYAKAAGRYGSPTIPAGLRREGDCVSVKTVAPWMRQAGLRARVARR